MRDECIVIAGGSIRGFGMLGALQYIDEAYNILNFNCFMGTSIGSIISYMLCLGMKPLEIVHSVLRGNILERIRTDITIDEVLERQGLANFDCILEELEIITLARYGKLFTVKELYDELGKEFGCVTFNYTKYKTEYIHHTTTPDVPCLSAIQMSSAIPFVFNKCLYKDCLYIDGGVVDNFPIRMAIKMGKKSIIGISSNNYDTQENNTLSIAKLISIPTTEKTYKTIRKFKKRHVIINVNSHYDVLDFNLEVPEIMEMFSVGYKSAKTVMLNTCILK